ncbi:hypothetical protein QTI05_22650 [Variovorax sp. J22R193]|uniref:hypothetical protein n=1 Tax=Variovorax fucosicus TaxID=3053517 RepID=UPI002578464B|nr:hypothetical protein [Variovorax sp. J22R193]MDM0041858.1 hypothetical protein [Variovorax sp. J22R193]
MSAQHTKGPWEVHGATMVWAPAASANIAAVSTLRDSQCVEYKRPSINSPDFAEIAANARLIAAAPELLKAAHAAIGALKWWQAEHACCWGATEDQEKIINAAIAKATGSTHE